MYDVDAKARAVSIALLGKSMGPATERLIAAALREARETALTEAAVICWNAGAALTACDAIRKLKDTPANV